MWWNSKLATISTWRGNLNISKTSIERKMLTNFHYFPNLAETKILNRNQNWSSLCLCLSLSHTTPNCKYKLNRWNDSTQLCFFLLFDLWSVKALGYNKSSIFRIWHGQIHLLDICLKFDVHNDISRKKFIFGLAVKIFSPAYNRTG